LEREPLAKQSIVASFFYSYREGELQTNHSHMLRSILYDVLMQDETLFIHFQSYYRQTQPLQPSARFQWPYNSLENILLSFRDHPEEKRLYIIIDAVDESDDKDRRKIIQLLLQFCSTDLKTPCQVKIFVASRPITGMSHNAAKVQVIKLQDENASDILKFTGSFLGPELELPSGILFLATEYIVTHAQGVFIWVRLVKEELLKYAERGCSQEQIFNFLKSLPTELEGFYKRILNQLEKGDKRDIEDGLRIFRFVLFAYRPLSLAELQQALAIEDDPDGEFTFSDELFNTKLIYGMDKRIVHCGGNFLEIRGHSGTFFL
jgi:hypothetical protein